MVGNKKIWYGLGLDNKSLQNDANKSKRILGGISDKAEQEGKRMDNTFKKLSVTVGAIFSVAAIGLFLKKMAMVRGEFQQLEVAFTTMLGSKKKADELMARTIDFAAKTPFDLQGVAQGTKQLLAYGSEAESVTEELGMLGNIAAGLSIPLNDIVYLFGTTRTQGRLFTMDLRQFMGRGIPLAKELAKQFGVAEEKVAGLVTAGKVGFEHVNIAMKNMTAQGGMFFNLMEEQSKTITGKMSNLGDGISQMFNKIGEANQDAMGGALDITIDLVDNYEKVGKILAELIGTYGVYRAALITTTVIQNIAVTASALGTRNMFRLTGALIANTVAQIKNNLAAAANPYVLIALAITGLVFVIYKLITAQSIQEKAQDRVNDLIEEEILLQEERKRKIDEAIRIIQDEVSTITQKQVALELLQKMMPNIFDNMDIEAIKLAELIDLNKLLNNEKEKESELSLKNTVDRNNIEILRLQQQFDKDFRDGNTERIALGRFELEQLKAENKEWQKKLALMEEVATRAKFNAQAPELKIIEKEKENIELTNSLSDRSKGPIDSTGINEDIRENNILIAKWREEVKKLNVEIINRANEEQKILDIQKKINLLQEKSKVKLTKKERVDLIDLNKQLSVAKADLNRMLGIKGSTAKPSKVKFDAEKIQIENSRKVENVIFESELIKLKLQEDGSVKSLALLELEGDRKITVLKRQKNDAILAMETDQKLASTEDDGFDEKIWRDRLGEFKKVWDDTIASQEETNKQASTTFLQDKYKTDLEDYTAFLNAYIDKKNKFDDNLKNLAEQGFSSDVIAKTKIVQDDILAQLDEEMEIKELMITEIAESLVTLGIEQILEQLSLAQKSLKEEFSEPKGNKKLITILKAKINVLTKLLNDKSKKTNENVTDKDWQKTIEALKDIRDITNDVIDGFDGMDDATKVVLKSAVGISASAIGMINGIRELSVSVSGSMAFTAKAAGESIKMVEKASIILAIVSAALQIITAIVSIFTGAKTKRKEREIEMLQKQVDNLKRAYDALGKSIDKAYSVDATNLIQQQDANLRRQKELLEAQIRAEEKKKKTDKGRIRQWEEAIHSIDEILAESEARQIEAINGRSINDAIESFADAYMEAWSAGENKAKAMKDVVKDMIRSAIAELVKSRMSGEVEAFALFLAQAMEDGILSMAEQGILDSLEAAIFNRMNDLSNTLDHFVVDNDEQSEQDRIAATKGFANMSQDTADELNGRFTVIQGHTFAIVESLQILKNNSAIHLQHLAGIHSNTNSLERLEAIENDIGVVKTGIEELNDLGIRIRT